LWGGSTAAKLSPAQEGPQSARGGGSGGEGMRLGKLAVAIGVIAALVLLGAILYARFFI